MMKPAATVGAMQRPQPSFEPRTYQILIKNNRFEPENLKIEKGSIVEWRVSCSTSASPYSSDNASSSHYDSDTDHSD